MKRTSKRYVVTSDALNCYGYRVLTSGIDISQYLKNPILLWMHLRADRNDKNQILPLGRAVDLQVEGDKITCYLEFDETDPFAMQVYNKYENGTLNMLSLGAKPLEWSDEPDQMVAGQTGPTFTKSKMQDISCVDTGGNDEACACELYDATDQKIELANITGEGMIKLFKSLQTTTIEKNENMKLIQLTGAALTGILLSLNLDENASEDQVQKAVGDMAKKNIKLKADLDEANTKKDEAEAKLEKLENAEKEAKVIALVDGAIADKKILPGQKETYIKLANGDFESTKTILDGMTGSKTVQEKIELGAAQSTELTSLIALSYDELWSAGKLERLKQLDNQAFLDKRAEKFPVKSSKRESI